MLIAGSYPNLTVRVHCYHVLLGVREDVLLTFSSLKAFMNHICPLSMSASSTFCGTMCLKTKGILLKGNLKYGVVSHLLPHFCTEEVGHYRAHVIFIKLLIIQIDQCPTTSYSSLLQNEDGTSFPCLQKYLQMVPRLFKWVFFFLFEVRCASFSQGWINFLPWFF